MADTTTMTVNMRVISDISDAKSNVESLQKSFSKLKLPDKLGEGLNKKIVAFYKEYEKYQKKLGEGIKTQGDVSQLEKSLNVMRSLYQEIGKDASKVTKLKINDLFDMNSGDFKRISDQIAKTVKDINNVKIDSSKIKKPLDDIRNLTKNSRISGKEGLLNNIIGHVNTGEIDKAKQSFKELEAYAKRVKPVLDESGKQIAKPGTMSIDKYKQLEAALNAIRTAFAKADADADPFIATLNQLEKEMADVKAKAGKDILGNAGKYNAERKNIDSVTESLKRMHKEEFGFNRQVQDIDRQIQSYFGLTQMIRKVGQIAKDAFKTVKELDAAMTETAVVTNFSVSDMWDMLPTYTEQANKLGSTIKDVYEAATLYYQQGLNQNQAMGLANETLKMARIGGLQAAEATDMMTAALRGFNMEINQTSAQKINDVYSQLAAITASNTKEIGSAMERTASIANSANMDFSTTSAFLAQMIETTREAPENLGTAMKTIIARFQEMKKDPTKLVDSEGVAMDVNKVDAALKTIGVALTNTKGEFRDLDDVFLDISARWDSLTQGQQRYIATIAAGSRQQSRFIAMMSNYNRTMELVDAANNSAGASQKQFEKTLESMSAKLNKLKNAWDQFTMGLMNNQILKFGVDALTKGFTIINKFIDVLGKIPPSPFEGITKSVLTLVSTLAMLNFGKKFARGMVTGTVGWYKEDKSFSKEFKAGYKGGAGDAKQSEQAGMRDAKAYKAGWDKIFKAGMTAKNAPGMTGVNILKQAFGIDQFKKNLNILKGGEALVTQLFPEQKFSAQAKKDMAAYLNTLRTEIKAGKITKEEAQIKLSTKIASTPGGMMPGLTNGPKVDSKTIDALVNSGGKLKSIGTGFTGLASKIDGAGSSLMNFGMLLQGTPLQPFGTLLSTVGMALVTFGGTLASLKAGFLESWAAATLSAVGVESEAGAALQASIANGTLTVSEIMAAGGATTLKLALIELVLPLMAIAAVIGLVVLAYKKLDAAIETSKERMERMSDAAAKASEAYSSAKQQTSELTDAIEQIKTNDNAFDGLVAGTADFNEQLIEANNKITELINKYPMLTDYLTTDSNGLMHISEEGFKAVEEEQKRIQSNAAALSMIQNAQLKKEQNERKAEKLEKARSGDTSEDFQKRLEEAKYLRESAQAAEDVAKQAAISSILSGEEIKNREKLTAIYAGQYDSLIERTKQEKASIEEMRQAYADFYGYTYDKSTKEIKDVEGNVVLKKEDDEVVKDAYEDVIVQADIRANGASLDKMLSTIDRKFSEGLNDTFKNTGSIFSDVMASSIDTNEDALKEVLQDPGKINEAIQNLNEKELAAILGVSETDVASNKEKFISQLSEQYKANAENIARAQAEAYSELGAMMAQSTGKQIEEFSFGTGKATTEAIASTLNKLTQEQKITISNVGAALRDNVGTDAMKTFLDTATEVYLSKDKKAIEDLDNSLKGVSWDSSISRLQAFKDMAESNTKAVKEMGESLLKSSDSVNIVTDAFTEFYNSSDFQDLSENMDNFINASGELDASSVEKMSKECGSLNDLLDTGAISAGGVAAALNALGRDGSLTIMDLNDNLLKFLSTANQLEDVLSSAHNIIENFDWGVDTGESKDFAVDSTTQWKELYEGGEFGNQQLENYAKFVLGEDTWNKILEKSGNNLEKAFDRASKEILKYEEGFDKVWEEMASSDKYKDIYYDENGDIIWDAKGKTTEELVDYLSEVRNISKDWAKLMVEDWMNYSPDFKAEQEANNFNAALRNGDFIESHNGAEGLTITRGEIQTLAKATGKDYEEVKKAIAESAGISLDKLNDSIIKNTDKEGNLLTEIDDIAKINKQYNKSELGSGSKESWISQYEAKNKEGQVIGTELKDAIAGAVADGINEEQATIMAWQEAQKLAKKGEEVYYNGERLTEEQLASPEAFTEAIQQITDTSQWATIGDIIGEHITSAFTAAGLLPEKQNENDVKTDDTEKGKVGSLPEDALLSKFLRWLESGSTEPSEYTGNNPTLDTQIIQAEEMGKATEGASKAIKGAWDAFIGALTSHEVNPKTVEGKTHASTKNVGTAAAKGVEEGIEEGANTAKPSGRGKNAVKKKTKQEVEKTVEEGTEKGATAATPKQTAPGMPSNAPQNQKAAKAAIQQQQQVETVAKVTVDTSEAEAKIENIKGKLETIPKEKGTTVTVTQNYETSGKKDNTKSKTIKVNYKANKKIENEPEDLERKVTYTAKIKNPLKDVKGLTAHYHPVVDGSIPTQYGTVKLSISEDSKKFKVVRGGAKGINNTIPNSSLPSLGSLAKGTRYGRVGPKGKGGLTLTGEEGFEIAWLPSESKSMILGTDGPQMLNLPSDAVVYTHEQSKKILKQKSISAGSHSKRPRKENEGENDEKTTPSKKEKKKGGKKGSNENSGSIKNIKIAEKVIKKADKVNTWWWNMTKKVEATQRKIDQQNKKIDKLIKDGNITLKSLGEKVGNAYIKTLKLQDSLNKTMKAKAEKQLTNLYNSKTTKTQKKDRENVIKAEKRVLKAETKLAKAKATKIKSDDKTAKDNLSKEKKRLKKAKDQLKKDTKGVNWADLSYEVTKTTTDKKGKKTKKKVTKKRRINLSPYINYDEKTGAYTIDYNKINKTDFKGIKRKDVVDAAKKKIEDLTGKRNTAEDNIAKAQEALEQFGEQLYENFFAWENELTKIWELTQKINLVTSQIDRNKSYGELLENQFKTNKISVKKYAEGFIRNFVTGVEKQTEKIDLTRRGIGQKINDLTNLINQSISKGNIEYAKKQLSNKNLSEEEKLGYKTVIEKTQTKINAINKAWAKYLKVSHNGDGTLDINFDTERFESDEIAGFLGESDAQIIQDYVKKLTEQSDSIGENINDLNEELNNQYVTLQELKDQWADSAEQLWEMHEEEQKTEIEQFKKLSDSINNAMKNLLDQIKRKLDERRKAEDNAKTERDISQKQQRLAMLRADTSGGHAVEIAQLEKEIADAQQSYERSLEDQLLEKLQNQADEAAKQREQMIALEEAILDSTNNAALVNKWMAHPEAYMEEIRKAWYAKNASDYDKMPDPLKQGKDTEWNDFWIKLTTNQGLQDYLDGKIEEIKGTIDVAEELQGAISNTEEINNATEDIYDSIKSTLDGEEDKPDEQPNEEVDKLNAEIKDLKEKITDLEDAIKDTIQNTPMASLGSIGATGSINTITPKKTEAETIKVALGGNSGGSGTGGSGKAIASSKTLSDLIGSNPSFKTLYNLAKKDEYSWIDVLTATKKKKLSASKIRSLAQKSDIKKSTAFKNAFKTVYGATYATGGLAKYTGPAWLDGTPSKPELVLNATDTKNFLALKDVLSKAINSVDSTVSTGNATYEININVDHLNSDYDVDKVAQRVKKIIVNDSSYRNVTQVRNFR